MNCEHCVLSDLTDQQLLDEVKRLAARERVATADLIDSLAELDARKLYLGLGYASLFSYCTQALGYSEDAAYSRITAARATARFPSILERLATGELTLTAVRLLAPHLTVENYPQVLDAARRKSKREVEELVARLQPQPDVRPLVRKLPVPGTRTQQSATLLSLVLSAATVAQGSNASVGASTVTGSGTGAFPVASWASAGIADDRGRSTPNTTTAARPSDLLAPDDSGSTGTIIPKPQRAVVAPLAPERYKVQFTVSAETRERLQRVQDLLRQAVPDGDLATIFDRALVVLLEELERTKWAATKSRKRRCQAERDRHGDGVTASAEVTGDAKPGQRADGSQLRFAPEPAQSPAVSVVQPVPEQVPDADVQQRPREDAQGQSQPVGRHKRSRLMPAAVRRAVWKRDGGQCAFVGHAGRCTERAFLQFHHLVPHGDGGEATVENLALRCKAHHGLEGDRWFGNVHVPWP